MALLALVATIAVLAAGPVSAAVGTNDVLDNEMGGQLYIPLKPSASGVLGDPIGGGPDRVGMQADSVFMSILTPSSSGYVTFELVFDISADLGLLPNIDQNSANLLMTFDDLDFKTDVSPKFTLNEVLTMEFRADPGGPTSGTPLTIDETNYHVYSGMPPGHETNNVTVTYEINLKNDLGISDSDFADMETDKEFAVLVTLNSHIQHTGTWCNFGCVTNTPESIDSQFTVVGVPEPATMGLLAIGAIGLIRRRRRGR